MNNKPKILFILQLPPPVHGSSMTGQYIKENRLINSSFDCKFINSSFSRNMNELGIMSFKKIFIYLSILFQTLKALLVFRPDLCYMAPTVKGLGFYKDFPIISLLKLFRKKIVFHLHNKGIVRYQDKWFDNKLYRFAFRDTKLILLSERLYDDVKRYADRKNVFVCPNGIPGQAIRKHYRVDAAASLLFLSNMMVAKGVYTLLDACTILKGKDIKYRCDFVGKWTDITEKDFQAAVKEKNLNDCVFAHGPKYGNEKAYFFEQTDIFAFPSYYHNECFPLVLLEAMQYGLPAISTDEGGIPHIIDDGITGYIVKKQNPKELADQIEILIANPSLREKTGKAGQKKFQEQFTLDVFERQMLDILNNISTRKQCKSMFLKSVK